VTCEFRRIWTTLQKYCKIYDKALFVFLSYRLIRLIQTAWGSYRLHKTRSPALPTNSTAHSLFLNSSSQTNPVSPATTTYPYRYSQPTTPLAKQTWITTEITKSRDEEEGDARVTTGGWFGTGAFEWAG
jgi:hypothetical protein